MKEKFIRVKEFTKEHWQEILAGGLSILGGAALGVAAGKYIRKKYIMIPKTYNCVTIPNPQFTTGNCIMTSVAETGWMSTAVSDIKISDLGRFGEELVERHLAKPDSVTDVLIGVNTLVEP